jgi:selenocysteine lyase/cysteine desulfurase
MLESYFEKISAGIIGNNSEFETPYGKKRMLYADWTASGRLYKPIEDYLLNTIGPWVANTHTETTYSGTTMTKAYHQAQAIIKKHVNADENDCLISSGYGMTSVINKFQRLLGLRLAENYKSLINVDKDKRPIVFITHLEHHSNQTSWIECECDVVIVQPDKMGLPDLAHLESLLIIYKNRPLKIGAFSACSNVTGIITPYHEMAAIMHKHKGYCFIDFAASAPYVDIDMHPENLDERLDAIFFSPHKCLGGPGSSGIMVFSKSLYHNHTPDQPGGGTVLWTNPWGQHAYIDDIESREDGGTPGFLQTIKAALALKLKEEITTRKILDREHEIMQRFFAKTDTEKKIHVLERHNKNRLGIVSLYILDQHFNLVVKLLNDRFGIQTRGGCSCAGTYGHILLKVDLEHSKSITDKIDHGDLTDKPGWIRVSLHPTLSNEETDYLADSLLAVVKNYDLWKEDYHFSVNSGEWTHKSFQQKYLNIDLHQFQDDYAN